MSMRMHLFPEGLNNCKIKVDNVIIIRIMNYAKLINFYCKIDL